VRLSYLAPKHEKFLDQPAVGPRCSRGDFDELWSIGWGGLLPTHDALLAWIAIRLEWHTGHRGLRRPRVPRKGRCVPSN
jgi:hypothetical protein